MDRALAVLTGVALLTIGVEATDDAQPLLAVGLGTVFALLVFAGSPWLSRRPTPRRYWLTAGYVASQLPLGLLLYGAAEAGVGATLLLDGPGQPERAAAAAAGRGRSSSPLVPLVHVGMALGDGLRNGLGTARRGRVHRRRHRAAAPRAAGPRASSPARNERLREYAAQAEELATTQERNRVARDIHDGLGHHLTVVQMQVQAARAVLADRPGEGRRRARQGAAAGRRRRWPRSAGRSPRCASRAPSPPLREALRGARRGDLGRRRADRAGGRPARSAPLPPEVEESLFRAAQEGLTNVRKHAAAASRAGWCSTTATTARCGWRSATTGRGTAGDVDGRRASACSGCASGPPGSAARLDVVSEPGGGTTVRVEVPG